MLALRLPKDLEDRLGALAARTGRTKSYCAKEAISEYLDVQEDYLLALARLEKQRPAIPGAFRELQKLDGRARRGAGI